jgi:hypothetical protein
MQALQVVQDGASDEMEYDIPATQGVQTVLAVARHPELM